MRWETAALPSDLEVGRDAFGGDRWAEAFDRFSAADRQGCLDGEDLRGEVVAAFPGWKITDVEPSGFELPKPMELILRPDEHWYRLRRE